MHHCKASRTHVLPQGIGMIRYLPMKSCKQNTSTCRVTWSKQERQRHVPVEAFQNLQHKQGVLHLTGSLHGPREGREQQLSQGGLSEGIPAMGGCAADGQLGQTTGCTVCWLSPLFRVLIPTATTHFTLRSSMFVPLCFYHKTGLQARHCMHANGTLHWAVPM